jgi:hypothetical protein
MFSQCLTGLRVPLNTAIDWNVGSDRAISRNRIAERSLERGSEWVWFVDDDHTFHGDILGRLLAHEQPVVGALYLQRTTPFLPIAMAERDDNGEWWPLDLDACPEHGLVQVEGLGTGGLLVRAEVFHDLEPPWFVHTTKQSEDLYFCTRVRDELDLPIYVDMDARLGHLGPAVVVPNYHETEGWVAGLSFGPSAYVELPILKPLIEEEVDAH